MVLCLPEMQIAWGYVCVLKFEMAEHLPLGEVLSFRWLRSRLYWASSHVHQTGAVSGQRYRADLRTGEVCHRGENQQGGDEGGTHLSVSVWWESRHEFHLSAVIEDFQSVNRRCTEMCRRATADGLLVYFKSHRGYRAVHWKCNTLGCGSSFYQVSQRRESRQKPLSLMEFCYYTSIMKTKQADEHDLMTNRREILIIKMWLQLVISKVSLTLCTFSAVFSRWRENAHLEF